MWTLPARGLPAHTNQKARKLGGPPGRNVDASLVVIAVDLFKESLGIECGAGTASYAGDDRKRNNGGQDGLHDHFL